MRHHIHVIGSLCALTLLAGCGDPPGSPPTSSATEALHAIGERIETSVLLIDADTEEPLPGATLEIYETGRRLTADDEGRIVLGAAWGERLRLSARHPEYATTHEIFDQAGWQEYGLYLRPRTAETFAEVRASDRDQTLTLGEATVHFPAGSLRRGTVLHVSLADARTRGLPENTVAPDGVVPQVLDQIRVDLPGDDPWAFHHVVDPERPVRVTYALDARQQYIADIFGADIYLTAGADAERVDPEEVVYEPEAGTLSFPLRHFSDATVTQKAQLTGGCGEPYALVWETLESSTSYEVHTIDAEARACGDARPVELKGAVTLSQSISRKRSIGQNRSESLSVGLTYGAKAKVSLLAGATIKRTLGYAFTGNQSSGESAAAGHDFKTGQSFAVAGTGRCDPRFPCEAWLEATLKRNRARFTRRIIHLEVALRDQPGFSQPAPSRVSCISGEAQPLRRMVDRPRVRDFGRCLATIFSMPPDQAEAAADGCGGQNVDAVRRAHEAIDLLVIESQETTFVSADVIAYRTGDACDPRDAAAPVPPERPAVDSGGSVSVRPATGPSTCAASLPRPLPAMPAADPLVPPTGPFPLRAPAIEVRGNDGQPLTVRPALTILGTIDLGPPREVAVAAACCERPGTQTVTATHSVQFVFSDTTGQRTATSTFHGGTFRQDADAGVALAGNEFGFSSSIDVKYMAGNQQILQSVFGRSDLFGRSNSARATATSTPDRCEAQGIFARRHRTRMMLTVDMQRGRQRIQKRFFVTANYFGAPVTGQPVRREGRCGEPDEGAGEEKKEEERIDPRKEDPVDPREEEPADPREEEPADPREEEPADPREEERWTPGKYGPAGPGR